MLCSNRFPLPGSPSTCTLDRAIVPLPSFLLFVGLAIIFFMKKFKPETPSAQPPSRWLHSFYIFVVLAAFGMTIVEISRDIAAHLGVGLLPANTVGLILVTLVLFYQMKGRTAPVCSLFAGYFLFLVIVEIIKTVRVNKLRKLHPAKGTAYPSSDLFLDNLVMLGLYTIAMKIEVVNLLVMRRSKTVNDSTAA